MVIPPRFVVEDDDHALLGQFTAYIQKVIGYAKLEYLRKLEYRQREGSLEETSADELVYEDPLPADVEEFDFAEERLSQVFSKLTLLRRRILTLIFVEGLSAQETADKLGCSAHYVYLQKHRTLKALRDQLMGGGGKRGD